MKWHSSSDGPFLKRLRISLFGLLAKELSENMRILSERQQSFIQEDMEEDRLFYEWWDKFPELHKVDEWEDHFEAYRVANWRLNGTP